MPITDKSALDALLTGTTHVLALGPSEAVVHYETADRAHMRLPDGTVRHGSWAITNTGYHVDWEGGPSADWQIEKTANELAYLNNEGVEVGKVIRIHFGDSESLI